MHGIEPPGELLCCSYVRNKPDAATGTSKIAHMLPRRLLRPQPANRWVLASFACRSKGGRGWRPVFVLGVDP
jgi:hypothetical protein